MLIATGIMAIGMVMIATIFPVGVKLTSLASERSIGAVAADEAFAKIQLYGLRDFAYWPAAQINQVSGQPNPGATYTHCDSYLYTNMFALGPDKILGTTDDLSVPLDTTWSEAFYPSTVLSGTEKQRYHWSALCRRVSLKEVQVTVFVNRKTSNVSNYRAWTCNVGNTLFSAAQNGKWPSPVKVGVQYVPGEPRQLEFNPTDDVINPKWNDDLPPADPHRVTRFFSEGVTIVDDYSGRIYRVMEYRDTDDDGLRDTLVLDQDWQWPGYPVNPPTSDQAGAVWVVPPAVDSDRYPCVGVYQKVLYFENIQ